MKDFHCRASTDRALQRWLNTTRNTMLYCIVLSVIFLWGKSTYPKGQEMSLHSARGSPTCPWPQHCGTQGIFHLFAIAQIIPMHFLGPTEISQTPQNLLHFPLLFIWIFPRTVSKELCLSLFSPTSGRYRDASAAPSPGAAASPPPRPGRERSRICPCRHWPLLWPPGPMPPTGPGTGEGAASPPRCRALRGEREDETSGAPLAAPAAPPPGPCPSAARHRPTGAGRGADGLGRAARRNGALGPDPRSPDPRSPPARTRGPAAARAPRSPPDAAIPPRSAAAAAARERAGHAAARPQRQRGSSGGGASPYLRRCLRGQWACAAPRRSPASTSRSPPTLGHCAPGGATGPPARTPGPASAGRGAPAGRWDVGKGTRRSILLSLAVR